MTLDETAGELLLVDFLALNFIFAAYSFAPSRSVIHRSVNSCSSLAVSSGLLTTAWHNCNTTNKEFDVGRRIPELRMNMPSLLVHTGPIFRAVFELLALQAGLAKAMRDILGWFEQSLVCVAGGRTDLH